MGDFVTYDLALKLKEKGFDEECIAYYHTDGELLYNIDQYRGGNYKSLLRSYNSLPKNPIGCEQIDAPTISQVLRWLLKEKETFIELLVNEWENSNFGFTICHKNDKGTWEMIVGSDYKYATFDKALLEAINISLTK